MSKTFAIQLLVVCIIILSCNQNIENKHITTKENTSNENSSDSESKFLSNTEVEKIISSKENTFLSGFSFGMTEDETIEVIRYLIDKGKMSGEVWNPDKQDYDLLYTLNFNTLRTNKSKIYYYNLTPKYKTHKFEVELSFSSQKCIDMISLANTNNVVLNDFDEIVELYTKKYGYPVEKLTTNNGQISLGCDYEVYRRYTFKDSRVKISITYTSECKRDNGGYSPSMISIIYEDIEIIEKNKQELYQDWENEQKNVERKRQESFDAI